MFCKFCGSPVSDNAVFCEKCGKKLEEGTPSVNPVPVYSQDEDRKGKVLASVKFNPSSMKARIIMEIISLIVEIFFVRWSSSLSYYEDFYEQKDLFVIIGVLAIIASIIALVFAFISIGMNSQIYAVAYNNMVMGRCTHSHWAMSGSDFSLKYDDIDSVTSSKNLITITSCGIQYIFSAASEYEADQFVSAINKRRFKKGEGRQTDDHKWKCNECGQLNSFAANRCTACGNPKVNGTVVQVSKQLASNEWRCPNCGRINQNYVGTCGCGQQKP